VIKDDAYYERAAHSPCDEILVCGDSEVLAWTNNIVEAAVNVKKGVRQDDPDKLVHEWLHIGILGGSTSMPINSAAILTTTLFERRDLG
jgi:hypothetical protein